MNRASRAIRIVPLVIAALVACIYAEPALAQEFLISSVEFDTDSDNRKVPSNLETWLTIPRRDGSWFFCVFGRNNAGKKGTFSFTESDYSAEPASPYVITGQFFEGKDKVKLARNEAGTAYGEACFTITFGTNDTSYVIIRIKIKTKATGKLPLDTFGLWGLFAGERDAARHDLVASRPDHTSVRPIGPEELASLPRPQGIYRANAREPSSP